MTDKPSLAARWSNRKQAVADEEAVEQIEAPVVEEQPVEPEKTEAEVLAEFNLKDPDQMEAGDDFSGFMNSAIPERLRNRALRKLWSSNPALANLDGLLDYGDDFTDKGGIVEDIVTAYKVGKGYFDKLVDEDIEGENDDETSGESDSEPDESDSEIVEEKPKMDKAAPLSSVRKPAPVRVLEPVLADNKSVEVTEVASRPTSVRRKRMNYRF